MHGMLKAGLAVVAAMTLSGCWVVKESSGDAEYKTTFWGYRMADPGTSLAPGWVVEFPSGGFVTITAKDPNGNECAPLTYYHPFIVPPDPLDCSEKKQDDKTDQDNQDPDQDQDPQQDQHQASNEGENGANGTEDSSGISAPQVTPTPVPDYSPGGEGGTGGIGMDGPRVIATGVPQYNVTGIVQTGTQLLEAALGIYATKKIGDNLDDDDHKGNSEGQPISP